MNVITIRGQLRNHIQTPPYGGREVEGKFVRTISNQYLIVQCVKLAEGTLSPSLSSCQEAKRI